MRTTKRVKLNTKSTDIKAVNDWNGMQVYYCYQWMPKIVILLAVSIKFPKCFALSIHASSLLLLDDILALK